MSDTDTDAIDGPSGNGDSPANEDIELETLVDRVDELAAENEELREHVAELEAELDAQPDIEFRGGDDIQHLWIDGLPFGKMLYNTRTRAKRLTQLFVGKGEQLTDEIVDDVLNQVGQLSDYLTSLSENGNGGQAVVDPEAREQLLPAHQMVLDLRSSRDLPISQQRAAVLFREFIRWKLADKDSTVTDGGQRLFLNTNDVRQVLEENDLLDVKEASKSKITTRALQDVHSLTKREGCDCNNPSECDHALLEFNPGRPHSVSVPKQRWHEYFGDVLETFEDVTDKDVRRADDGVNGGNSPEAQETDADFEKLEKAKRGENK